MSNVDTVSKENLSKYSLYIVIGVVLVAEVMLTLYHILGSTRGLSETHTKIPVLQKEVDDLERAISLIDNQDPGAVERNLNAAAVALPTDKKVSGLVSGLSALASTKGATVSKLEFTPCKISTRSGALRRPEVTNTFDCENPLLGENVKGVALDMTVLASEVQLVDFVKVLQKVSPRMGIKVLDYTVNASPGKQAKISVLVYFQQIPQADLDPRKAEVLNSQELTTIQQLSGDSEYILPQ